MIQMTNWLASIYLKSRRRQRGEYTIRVQWQHNWSCKYLHWVGQRDRIMPKTGYALIPDNETVYAAPFRCVDQ